MSLTSSPGAARQQLATDLVGAARAGDRQAMGSLYLQYRELIYRHAYRMLRCEASARARAKETFARALGAIGRTREPLHFRAWVLRIATNLCLKQIAQRRRWVGESRREAAAPPSANPERASRHQQAAAAAQRALDRLPPQYRQLLLLRELEELSYDELAQSLQSSKGRIKVTLHRARVRLGAEVLAEKLRQDGEARAELGCEPLCLLLDGGAPHRKLVRHLESCSECKEEGRSSRALLGMLPPIAAPATWPELGSPIGASTGARGRASQLAVALALLAGAALLAAAFAYWRTSPARSMVGEGATPRGPGKTAKFVPAGAQGAKATTPEGETLRNVAAAAPSGRPLPHARASRTPAAASRPAKVPRAVSRPALSPLQVKVQPSPRRLWVRREGARLAIQKSDDLRAGDLLEVRGARMLALRFPDHQWVAFDRRLRLVASPTKRDETITPRVELTRGQLRARASRRGGGIEVRVGKVTLRILTGLVRVRRVGRAIWVEAIEGAVTLTAGGVARRLSSGQGARFAAGRGEASLSLLAASARLRPVSGRGPRSPTLHWQPVAGAEAYLLRFAGDTDFIKLRKEVRVRQATYTPRGLRPGAYFWQVLALRGEQQGMPSKIFRFEVTRH